MISIGTISSLRTVRLLLAAIGVLALGIASADARVGGGISSGSRGFRTFTAPPSTSTAPRVGAPIQRSMTQPSAGRPMTAPVATGSRFAGGFGSMLMGGLIGAGLFGLLTGHGLFGGMLGFASFVGLLLQIALIGGMIYMAMAYFRGRQLGLAGLDAVSGGMGGMGRSGMMQSRSSYGQPGHGQANYGTGGGMSAGASFTPDKRDFDAFERLLGQIQDAYGREDTVTLRGFATPEMMSFFSDDLAENARKGVRNDVHDAKLLQGDLAEAWRETDAEYATVAMRFELIDTMVERATGRVVSGDPRVPQQVTEVWTFQRRRGAGPDGWRLSAIQQTN